MNYRETLERAAEQLGKDDGWQHIFEDWDGPSCDDYDWNPLESLQDALEIAFQEGYSITYPRAVDPMATARSQGGLSMAVRADSMTRQGFDSAMCQSIVRLLLADSTFVPY